MTLDFVTPINVEKSVNGKTIYGKTKLKWSFSLTVGSLGIKWMSIIVPDQTLSLDLTEEIYDEKTDTDDTKEYTEEYPLVDAETEGSVFHLIQDIYPLELVIPTKGKPYVRFPETKED